MKTRGAILVAFVCMLLSLTHCEDKRNTEQQHSNTINNTVGKQIPLDVAERWINTYQQSETSRTQGDTVAITPSQLRNIVAGLPELVGIALHHAYDASGAHHILLLPVAKDMNLWTTTQLLDATSGAILDLATAKAWANNYVRANARAVQYHFFGADVFNTILVQSGLSRVEIAPAINDEGKPQLILLAVSINTSSRTENITITAYDFSNPCPPCTM